MAQSAAAVILSSVVVMWLAGISVESAIPYSSVLSSLSSCIGYAQRGGTVQRGCCDGLKSLNNAAKTTPDVQDFCRCFKTLVPGLGARPDLINSIPGKCGVNLPYKYSPSLDCSKVIR